MKKLINSVENVVNESLAGFCAAHSDIVRIGEQAPFVQRRHLKPGKVALVSGGGSGHEPLHTGFVGYGMLDAACPGQVFTSPTPDLILAAAEAADTGGGVLFIVKNYEGDAMNFDMAREMSGKSVATVTTDDDVAVETSTFSTGRRGVAGTLIVEKILGAAAEEGREAVHQIEPSWPPIIGFTIGKEGDLIDTADNWHEAYGVGTEGAVLVRPDGYVAWRCRSGTSEPGEVLRAVFDGLLGRDHPATDLSVK